MASNLVKGSFCTSSRQLIFLYIFLELVVMERVDFTFMFPELVAVKGCGVADRITSNRIN